MQNDSCSSPVCASASFRDDPSVLVANHAHDLGGKRAASAMAAGPTRVSGPNSQVIGVSRKAR